MKLNYHRWLLLISLSSAFATNEPDLPPCPTHLQYLPQDLPMHCKMVHNRAPRSPQFPGMPPYVIKLPPGVSTLPPDKMPFPYPQFPPIPPPGMPALPGMPAPMPMPVPIPAPMPPVPPHKLPVIVMPFYSQDGNFKKKVLPRRRKPRFPRRKRPIETDTSSSSEDSSDTDTDTDSSSSREGRSSDEHGWWKRRHKKRKRKDIYRRFNEQSRERKNPRQDLLTPVLQYVTKDGYVIFEKKISKNEARDWLATQNQVIKVDIESNNKRQNKVELLNASLQDDAKEIAEVSKFKAIDSESDPAESATEKKHRTKKSIILLDKDDIS